MLEFAAGVVVGAVAVVGVLVWIWRQIAWH